MTSLFIDTSSTKITIAIIKNNNILSLISMDNDKTLSERVFEYIIKCFNDASVNVKNIDKIFVVNGPGSFTGIRVGVTIAKTMAWALKVPVIPLSELELIATTPVNSDYIIPYIDARRDFLFAAIYTKDLNSYLQDQYISVNELYNKIPKDETITWVGYDLIDNIDSILPNIDIIKLINKHMSDEPINPHHLNPNYLKKTEAEENLINSNV